MFKLVKMLIFIIVSQIIETIDDNKYKNYNNY